MSRELPSIQPSPTGGELTCMESRTPADGNFQRRHPTREEALVRPSWAREQPPRLGAQPAPLRPEPDEPSGWAQRGTSRHGSAVLLSCSCSRCGRSTQNTPTNERARVKRGARGTQRMRLHRAAIWARGSGHWGRPPGTYAGCRNNTRPWAMASSVAIGRPGSLASFRYQRRTEFSGLADAASCSCVGRVRTVAAILFD